MRDNEIIDLYWNRDEAAIAATVDTYENYCLCVAYNILGCQEDAQECVNDTWMKAWNSIPPQRPDCLVSYLGRITRNLALNRYKRSKAQKRGMGQAELALAELGDCVSARDDVEQTLDGLVLTNAIETFLHSLSRTERRIFIGRYWYLYPIRTIAKAYRMSESKVTSMLYRTRKKLKLHLEKEGIFL